MTFKQLLIRATIISCSLALSTSPETAIIPTFTQVGAIKRESQASINVLDDEAEINDEQGPELVPLLQEEANLEDAIEQQEATTFWNQLRAFTSATANATGGHLANGVTRVASYLTHREGNLRAINDWWSVSISEPYMRDGEDFHLYDVQTRSKLNLFKDKFGLRYSQLHRFHELFNAKHKNKKGLILPSFPIRAVKMLHTKRFLEKRQNEMEVYFTKLLQFDSEFFQSEEVDWIPNRPMIGFHFVDGSYEWAPRDAAV